MTLNTVQAFARFLEDISPTEHQLSSFIPNRKESVDKDLAAGFPDTSDMPYWRGELMGSASKGTAIRPLDDIDVLAVFSNRGKAWEKYRGDSRNFLYRVRRVYDGFNTAQVGARGQAVRVFYKTGGHVDVAPVFDNGDGVFDLPAGDGTWIKTSPLVAIDWYRAKDKTLNYHLSPLVRLLKAWNRSHSKRLQSFHLETIAANTFSSLSGNYRDALHKFFTWAPSHLDVSDPGGQSGVLSGYLFWKRTEVLQALQRAADQSGKALEAEARGDHDEAKRLWRIILGDAFPS